MKRLISAVGIFLCLSAAISQAQTTLADAKALYDSDQLVQARQAFLACAKAAPAGPGKTEAEYYALHCLLGLQNFSAFKTEAADFVTSHPESKFVGAVVYHEGVLAKKEKDWPGALAKFERVIAQYPDNPEQILIAKRDRALCLFEMDNINAYLPAFEELRRTKPTDQQIIDLLPRQMQRGEWYLKKATRLKEQGRPTDASSREEIGRNLIYAVRNLTSDLLTSGTLAPALYREIERDFLMSPWYENNFSEMIRLAGKYAADHASNPSAHGRGMLYVAIGKACKTPVDLSGAASLLDEIIASKIQDVFDDDHLPTNAAYWRVSVALTQNDKAMAVQCLKTIRDEMPDTPAKPVILARYSYLLQNENRN